MTSLKLTPFFSSIYNKDIYIVYNVSKLLKLTIFIASVYLDHTF